MVSRRVRQKIPESLELQGDLLCPEQEVERALRAGKNPYVKHVHRILGHLGSVGFVSPHERKLLNNY